MILISNSLSHLAARTDTEKCVEQHETAEKNIIIITTSSHFIMYPVIINKGNNESYPSIQPTKYYRNVNHIECITIPVTSESYIHVDGGTNAHMFRHRK